MLKKVTIYGERCSGTNYLEELLVLNFNVEIVWNYGWKHFFGFNDLSNSDDTLFIGIIRNLEDWINSLYRQKYHLPRVLTTSNDTYLNDTFYSINYNNDEIMSDRNIDTGERYKNIFELRFVKNKFLIEKMPKLVKNYCLITYDNLIDNFKDVMNNFNNFLQIKDWKTFPLNIEYNTNPVYRKQKNTKFIKKSNNIPKEKIKNKIKENTKINTKLLFYENLLFTKNSLM
jgi:hypothetical protein